MKTLFSSLGLALAATTVLAQTDADLTLLDRDRDTSGFKSLFNGRDLSGWEGNKDLWSVEDGAITGRTPPQPDDPKKSTLKHNTFLVYQGGEFGDFELHLKYRIVEGNSGIQYRSKVLRQGEQGPVVGGYQADFEAGKTYSGILYDEGGVAGKRGIMAQRGEKVVWNADGQKEVTGSLGKSDAIQARIRPEQWNDYVIIAQGHRLRHYINGVQTVDITDNCAEKRLSSGVLALQIHVGPPMTVQFKDIRIKELGQRSDLERFQGSWMAVEVMANGERSKEEDFAGLTVKFTGQNYETTTRDNTEGGTFELNSTQQPAWMNIINHEGNQLRAIYEFKDDTLRVCLAGGKTRVRTTSPPRRIQDGFLSS
jgi:uncharacterized protein (TIGR03067 family)